MISLYNSIILANKPIIDPETTASPAIIKFSLIVDESGPRC